MPNLLILKDPGTTMIKSANLCPSCARPQDSEDPCPRCLEFMKDGIILVSISDKTTTDAVDGDTLEQNLMRTGGWAMVSEEQIRKRIKNPDMVQKIIEERLVYIPDEAWDALGLPRPPGPGGT